jgi:hypothetical protein
MRDAAKFLEQWPEFLYGSVMRGSVAGHDAVPVLQIAAIVS